VQDAGRYGLCNRLRGWIGLGAIAEISGYRFAARWTPNAECRSTFTDIFVPYRCVIFHSDYALSQFEDTRVFRGKQASMIATSYQRMLQKHQDKFYPTMRKYATGLKLRTELQQQLDEFMATVPDDAIGVHVRRTDYAHRTVGGDRRLVKRLRHIINREPDATFLVCADNKNTIDMLREHFGDRIFWREQDMSSKQLRRTTQADAAIDLYSLARTRFLVGTVGSSFSKYAAFLGKISLRAV
jgi:hypothetical protein